MTTEPVEVDAVAWALLEGYPWWPVYVFDAKKVRLKFHLLGKSIVKNKPMFIQKWLCTKHESFLGGFPKVYFKRDKDLAGNLTMAYQEVVNYLARDAATRTLPLMVPSDTDPSLEPPSNPIRALQHQDSCMTREIDDHDEMLKKAKEKIKSTKRSGSDATGSTPHKKVKTSVVVESKHSDHGQSQAH
ncbi:unnamed protein product [Aphanomyces euteiches]